MLDEQVGDEEAELGRVELALPLLHVVAGLDGPDDGGIGRGPADAVLLELLHEARLAEARRRLREVLVGVELAETEAVALGQGRELGRRLLGRSVVRGDAARRRLRRPRLPLLVRRLLVDGEEALELQRGALRAQEVPARLYVRDRLVVDGGQHLGGHEAVPDELVERVLVLGEVALERFGIALGIARPDGLVRVLGVLLALVEVRLLGQVLRAVGLSDLVAHGADRVEGDAGGVRAHVRDQADGAVFARLDAFVEALRHLHRLLDREAQLLEGLLLELGGDEGGHRMAAPLLVLDLADHEGRGLEVAPQGFRRCGQSGLPGRQRRRVGALQ